MPRATTPRYLPPRTTARRLAGLRALGLSPLPLRRRGIDFGYALVRPAVAPDGSELLRRWGAAEPIVLPGALARSLPRHHARIAASLRLFDALRAGASFQDALWRRLRAHAHFVPAGSSRDLGDTREIEKVWVHARGRSRPVARDLWAKLSWIAHDERDLSLRIRFSFGAEALLEWTHDPRRSVWADRYAQAVFPECAAVLASSGLTRRVEALAGRSTRFSERIVYNNAPRGGASFHHDAEPHQLGVLYAQLAGETGWLALPKRELAREIAHFLRAGSARSALARRCASPAKTMAVLGAEGDLAVGRLLNATPAFVRRLIEQRAFLRLRPGDALLLPNHGPDDTCWHSVFALGERPSLAHSYGIFAARRTGAEARVESRRYAMAQAR